MRCQTKTETLSSFRFQKNYMKKFLLPSIDKPVSFSPKKPLQILAERRVPRREVELSFLQNSNWRCLFENIRTELAELGGGNSPHTPLPPASP